MTPEDKSVYDRAYRKAKRATIAEYQRVYKQRTKYTPKNRYRQQKENARKRGIAWEFTLGTWLLWWGLDYLKRGVNKGQLMMCRYKDTGDYSPTNCYKGTPADNNQDNWDNRKEVTL
jgi:hypothetical protein